MAATPAQTANALISFFVSQHNLIRGTPLVVNRYAAKWGVQDMVSDLGEDRVRELMVFFFKTNRAKYDMTTFLNIYDQLDKMKGEQDKDAINRAALREKTRLLVEAAEREEQSGEDRGSTD